MSSSSKPKPEDKHNFVFRNCIGQHFAMAELKVTLAQVLRNFEFVWDENVPPITLDVGVTLLPKGGVPVIVKRLQK